MEHSLERQFELTQLRERIMRIEEVEDLKVLSLALLELNFRMKTTVEVMMDKGWLIK